MTLEVLLAAAIGMGIGLTSLYFAARGAITICLLEVIDGNVRVQRGGIAPQVLADIRDVVRRPRVKHARIRILRAKQRARLEVSGNMSSAQRQQLRNVVGTVPYAKLINAPQRR